MNENTIISHVSSIDKRIQTNEEHSLGVAALAKTFASEFDMADWGWMLGLLHDKGKERESFQKYIREITGLDSEAGWHGEDKQHAFVGAALVNETYGQPIPLLTYPIMGHHSGLDDYQNHSKKLDKPVPP